MDFVEICNVYIGKMMSKAAKRIFNSDKICRSYSDLNFDATFLEHSVYCALTTDDWRIQVDTYGKCGKLSCPRSQENKCLGLLERHYKFYLAFENSNCDDYITEKFWASVLK